MSFVTASFLLARPTLRAATATPARRTGPPSQMQQQVLLRGVSVLQHPLHFGPRTSITTPLRYKGLEFGLFCSSTLKYASSRGRGNVVIPKGFPKSVGRVESCSWLSMLSILCHFHGLLWRRFSQSHIHREGPFWSGNDLSEMATITRPGARRSASALAKISGQSSERRWSAETLIWRGVQRCFIILQLGFLPFGEVSPARNSGLTGSGARPEILWTELRPSRSHPGPQSHTSRGNRNPGVRELWDGQWLSRSS
jgi:hypothetical protein